MKKDEKGVIIAEGLSNQPQLFVKRLLFHYFL